MTSTAEKEARMARALAERDQNDDFERITCRMAGRIGHGNCGWCDVCDTPAFECAALEHQPSRKPVTL